MATHARQQYFADEVSLQKDSREFSIADEVQQKIDWIEEWAQVNVIETVKVNWEPLTPDEDKAVDITVPWVIDNLYSTSVSDALSARQGKVLYDYLQNIASRWRYLSNWNCATGLAMTNPEESPYEYKAWDYYTVSDVAALWGTNYRPDGSEYIIWQASTVVETEDVSVSDFYLYDGTNWLLLSNSGRSIAIDSSLSTTSTNPVENRVITNAINNKADATDVNTKTFYLWWLTVAQEAYEWYLAWKNPILVKDNKVYVYAGWVSWEVWFTNDIFYQVQYSQWTSIWTTLLKLKITNWNVTSIEDWAINEIWVLRPGINYSTPYVPQYDWSPATKKYVDDHAWVTYTAGNWINITNNVISADTTVLATKTDLSGKQDELTAWENITIENVCVDISDMQWPAPDWFHIPLQSEWAAVKNIWTALWWSGSDWEVFGATLKMPLSGQRNYSDGSIYLPGNGSYWSSSYYGATNEYASKIYFNRFQILPYADDRRAYWQPIRAFKNTPVTPDSSWTMLYWTSIAAWWIFRSATEGLISLSSDWQTWVTMADKNLWATTVWNNWDTLSQDNSGNFYQWWNNYGFSYSWSITTSSTQVDATWYWPENYYESDTFIIWSDDWSSVQNNNLWWGVSQWSTQECNLTISAQVPEIEVDDEISSISENPVQNKVIKEALDEKVNLWLNKVFDSTTVEIGKWVDEWWMQGSWHHVTIDPNGEVSAYNVTSWWYNEAKLWTDWLTLLENSALWGDETTVISQDWITITEWNTTKTYDFLWNDRIATLSDISWGTTQWWNIVWTLSNQTDLTTYIDSHDTVVSATAPSNPTEWMVWYDTTNDSLKAYNWTSWETEWTKMVVLEYWVSTWQDFLDAYNKNALVYCKVSSWSSGYRMAFMAYTAWSSTPTEVEFQYYRSRSSHSTAANQLDEVYVYKLTNAWVWTTTQRDTAAKAIAWTWIGLSFNSSGMTISADTSVLATKADIADFGWFEVVATLPATGETNIIYLLWPIGTWADKYEEWIYASSTWTKIWETSVDLSDLNTKTFYINGTSDLTNAQAAYNWYTAGKNPIIMYNNMAYIIYSSSASRIYFASSFISNATAWNSVTQIKKNWISFSLSSWTVTAININNDYGLNNYLDTSTNYTTPYTPLYDGSPATKKYVDDNVVQKSSTAPSSPTEWMVWYDTTNDVLKVYDGTNWNEVGSWAWDMLYADFNWQAKTWTAINLDLASTITPTANFTVNAPSTIRDGQTYILRVNNWATAYTMTLGTNITNPYQESTLLTADWIDQFIFLAVWGNLELQPSTWASVGDYVESVNWNSWAVTLKTINSTSIVWSGNIAVQATLSNITAAQIKTWTATAQRTVTAAALAWGLVRISDAANNMLANGWKLWAWTQEDYEALTSYNEDTVYLTI